MAHNLKTERLTPLDTIMPRTYIRAFLVFRVANTGDAALQKLRAGLDLLAKQVPWLCGRVVSVCPDANKAASFEIQWGPWENTLNMADKGSTTVSYKAFCMDGMQPTAIPDSVWPMPDMAGNDLTAPGAPIFDASVFRFAGDEGIGLCICLHHNVVDAFGFAEIAKLWARNMGSPERLTPIPTRDGPDRLRRYLSSDLEIASSKSLDALFASHPEYSRIPPNLPSEFPPCVCKVFGIPVSQVQSIKHRLSGFTSTTPTTNAVVCALIWSAITRSRARRSPNLLNQTSRLVTAVNGRPRINADLSGEGKPFLANLVLYAMAAIPAPDLDVSTDKGRTQVLANICDAISQSQAHSQINSRSIAEVYNLAERVGHHGNIHVGWDLFNSQDLTITSWSDLDLYQADFGVGLGKPDCVRVPCSQADGVGLILPRKRFPSNNDGSEVVEIMVMLRDDDMNVLEDIWDNLLVRERHVTIEARAET